MRAEALHPPLPAGSNDGPRCAAKQVSMEGFTTEDFVEKVEFGTAHGTDCLAASQSVDLGQKHDVEAGEICGIPWINVELDSTESIP